MTRWFVVGLVAAGALGLGAALLWADSEPRPAASSSAVSPAAAPPTPPPPPPPPPASDGGQATVCGERASEGPATAGTVVIDPGHDGEPNSETEPIGPGSGELKVKDPGGTSGVVTGVREAEVVLAVSLRLRELLRGTGIRTVMTRTDTSGPGVGNVARAQVANRAGADLFLRVHADGSEDAARRGTHTLHPARIDGWTDDIYEPSLRAAELVQRELVASLGSRDLGLQERADLTGFNWSDVPSILVELGFMSNPDEDRLLTSPGYQNRAARGLCVGVVRFLREGG
jgi:N-acetylmuramoyl-L-alanine amidase